MTDLERVLYHVYPDSKDEMKRVIRAHLKEDAVVKDGFYEALERAQKAEAELAELRQSRDGWEATAAVYAQNDLDRQAELTKLREAVRTMKLEKQAATLMFAAVVRAAGGRVQVGDWLLVDTDSGHLERDDGPGGSVFRYRQLIERAGRPCAECGRRYGHHEPTCSSYVEPKRIDPEKAARLRALRTVPR